MLFRSFEQHDELVAAQARHGVGCAGGRLQPPRKLDQHGITAGVAVTVVDRLEAIDVDDHESQPDGGAVAPSGLDLGNLVGQVDIDRTAIAETGQRIGPAREFRTLRDVVHPAAVTDSPNQET